MSPPRRLLMAPVFALILVASQAARADDPRAPARLTPGQAADAAVVAVAEADTAALQTLAAREDPDPWRVVDELCFRGRMEVAAAFARVALRASTRGLAAYVDAWHRRETDVDERELLASLSAGPEPRTPQQLVEATASLPESLDTVVRIRLAHARGIALRQLRRFEDGVAVLRRAADAARAMGWARRTRDLLLDAGSSATAGGAWDDAHAAFEEALVLSRTIGDQAGVALAMGGTGVAHYEQGGYRAAFIAFEQALAVSEALGDRVGVARSLGNAALALSALGEYERALEWNQRALAIQESLQERPGAARTLGRIGLLHELRGEYAEALSVYERALSEQRALGARSEAAGTLGAIGNVHHATGHYADALTAYQTALAEFEALDDTRAVATTIGNIGNVHSARGEFGLALSLHERALADQEKLGDRVGAARTLGNIGNDHKSLGEYAKALSAYKRSLATFQEMGDRASVALGLNNIGTVHFARGEYAQAFEAYEQALSEQETLGDRAGAATTLGNLGSVHEDLGDTAQALAFHQRALGVQEEIGDRAGVATTLGNLGNVYLARGDHARALASHERALALQEALGDQAGAARTLGNIGVVYAAQGEPAKALRTHLRALAVKEALGDRAGAARSLGNVGLAHLALGDTQAAREALERAVRSARSARAAPVLVEVLTDLARLNLQSGDAARALGAAREALMQTESLLAGLGEIEGSQARMALNGLYGVGVLAALRLGDSSEALSFLESGRAGALLDVVGNRELLQWESGALPPALVAAQREARAEEALAHSAYDRAVASQDLREARERARALDAATERVREVEGRVQRALKARAGLLYPRAETIEAIASGLEADQALVLYGLCLDEALALVLRRGGPRIVSLGTVRDVVAACRALDLSGPEAGADDMLSELRRVLVDPLGLGEDVRRVLVSPEGELSYLPVGALFDRPVSLTPSGTTHVLLLSNEQGPGRGVLALGDPDYGPASEAARAIYWRGHGLSPLPATRAEVRAIGTTALVGAEANEVALGEALSAHGRWRAVHFACHGLIDVERPLLSSLALSPAADADGFLTALEVLHMDIPADLAVLSACETGRGQLVRGEGIVGLTRAFMYAGVPRVLCSLWKVDDEATRALMTRFYELWNPAQGPGLDASDALRKAQSFVRHHPDHPAWAHPYYWAAWVLWGLP